MKMNILKSEKQICPCCMEEHEVKTVQVSEQVSFKDRIVSYNARYMYCDVADELYMDEEQIRDNDIVGIGEIGLDYHYGKENAELQKKLFHKQMVLAEKYHLPVVIHSRDATEDTIAVLKQYPNVIGDIHCFSGSIETAKIYISMGYKIGIGGVVTFKNSNLYKVVENIGLDSIILETDAPYLAPTPFRGSVNSSKYIPYIAEKIANILNISVDDVARITTENASWLFDLK